MPTAARARSNGRQVVKSEPPAELLTEARLAEDAIAAEAEKIRGDATTLTAGLFMQLWPLLRRPIHEGFLVAATAGEGKPYESTGVRSVQVLVDRMDNVLSPLWWHQEIAYHDDGKLCEVTVEVHVEGQPIRRTSWGGVNRGSTQGNLYKGSYTNAGKRAFALLGPGHEVYVGATDYDPDVNEAAARAQTTSDRPASEPVDDGKPIGPLKASELVDAAWMLNLQDKLQLAASHVVGDDVGDCSSKTTATDALARLTRVQAAKVERWLNQKADEAAAREETAGA